MVRGDREIDAGDMLSLQNELKERTLATSSSPLFSRKPHLH